MTKFELFLQTRDRIIEDFLQQRFKACFTGSSLLGAFEDEHQDFDIFAYNPEAFAEILYYMYYHKSGLFQIIDPFEKRTFNKWKEKGVSFYSFPLITIKFKYNLLFDVNVICKKDVHNIFDVLSNFDMDIIARGIDLHSGQELDLYKNRSITPNVAHVNPFNYQYEDLEYFTVKRTLRQFIRCVKYYKRGFNVDAVVQRYLEMLNYLIEYDEPHKKESMLKFIDENKSIAKTFKKIILKWQETKEWSDENNKICEELLLNDWK